MVKTVQVEVITPSKLFYKGDAELVIVTTREGDEGFMAGHEWACKLLDVGEMWIRESGEKNYKIAVVAEGYIDVKDSIIIYTDAAEWADEIDVDRAKTEKERAEAWLKEASSEGGEYTPDNVRRAQIALAKSLERLKVAQGGGRRKR